MDAGTGSSSGGAASGVAEAGAMAAVGGLLGSVTGKWEGSKGQEVLTSVSSSIPESTKEYLNNAKAKLFNTAYIRSPKVFFGIGEDKPFFYESEMSLLGSRLKHNFSYFYLNYFIMTAILFVLTLFISPGALIGIGLLGIAWASVIKATQSGSMKLGAIEISQKQASIVMSGISVVVLFYILSHVFWWTLATSGFFVGAHAVFRDASMHKDEEDKVQMTGDVLITEEDAFLGEEVDDDVA